MLQSAPDPKSAGIRKRLDALLFPEGLPRPNETKQLDAPGCNPIGNVRCEALHRIVLKNSKIAGLRKSRKCRILTISATARLCRIDTNVSDRFASIDVVPHLAARK